MLKEWQKDWESVSDHPVPTLKPWLLVILLPALPFLLLLFAIVWLGSLVSDTGSHRR
jgi:hypothetical protein